MRFLYRQNHHGGVSRCPGIVCDKVFISDGNRIRVSGVTGICTCDGKNFGFRPCKRSTDDFFDINNSAFEQSCTALIVIIEFFPIRTEKQTGRGFPNIIDIGRFFTPELPEVCPQQHIVSRKYHHLRLSKFPNCCFFPDNLRQTRVPSSYFFRGHEKYR